jgi:hypothetical protein
MSTTDTRSTQRLKLFLRADPEPGTEAAKQEAVNRLTELTRSGHIDDYEVHVWGKELRTDGPLASTDYQQRVLSHVREFQAWADRHGYTLNGAFDRRTVRSSLAGESFTVLSLPTLCLGVYEGNELTDVYPCHDGEEACSVTEYLKSFEEANVARFASQV